MPEAVTLDGLTIALASRSKRAMKDLSLWANFYVILGSSAGALIGLQFVVVTLIASLRLPNSDKGMHMGGVFVTPSIVHFGVDLALSAIACVPWDGLMVAAMLWVAVGLAGVVYTLQVARRLRAQQIYDMEMEDWVFHMLLPIVAYAMLGAAGALAAYHAHTSLFVLAGGALMLLFIGIHNAWDNVTHMVFVKRFEVQEDDCAAQPTNGSSSVDG